MASRPPFILSPAIVIIDLLGALLAALGMWSLIDPGAETRLGLMAEPMTAALLLVVGLGLMGYAIVTLLARAKRASRRPRT